MNLRCTRSEKPRWREPHSQFKEPISPQTVHRADWKWRNGQREQRERAGDLIHLLAARLSGPQPCKHLVLNVRPSPWGLGARWLLCEVDFLLREKTSPIPRNPKLRIWIAKTQLWRQVQRITYTNVSLFYPLSLSLSLTPTFCLWF